MECCKNQLQEAREKYFDALLEAIPAHLMDQYQEEQDENSEEVTIDIKVWRQIRDLLEALRDIPKENAHLENCLEQSSIADQRMFFLKLGCHHDWLVRIALQAAIIETELNID